MLGFHLMPLHNVIHLASGALLLWVGLRGAADTVQRTLVVFGAVYGLLGVAGFVLGDSGSIAGHGEDAKMLTIVPGSLVLGVMDHALHVALGVIFVVAGAFSGARAHDTPTTRHTPRHA